VTALAVAVASPAWAVPAKFNQQGRLLDTSGQPLTGTHALVFALYDASTGGVQQWSEYHSTDFDSGYYTVTLGDVTPLDDALFSGAPLWLEIAVDGVTLEPRQEVAAVPWALRAISAERVDGGVVDAASISIGGTPVVDSTGSWVGPTPSVDWTELSGVPADIADGDQDTDSLASLLCAEGQVAKWTAGAWACADDVDTVTTSLPWASLTSIPPDIADGDQDTDTLGDLSSLCLDGDRAAWDAAQGQWVCAPSQVSLTQLDTTGAAAGQVLTFDGFNVGWEGGGATSAPCSLDLQDETLGVASFLCGASRVSLRTWMQFLDVMAAGDHSCGLRVDGSVTCWGYSGNGALLAPTTGTYTELSGGHNATCALSTDGSIACWGNATGASLDPPTGAFTQISYSGVYGCGIRTDGAVECWGWSGAPAPPSGPFSQVAASMDFACAVSTTGTIECWGNNHHGQSAPPAGSFAEVKTGSNFSCGIRTDGAVECWGNNLYGQSDAPPGTFTELGLGSFHSCGIETDGSLACWGYDGSGQASPPASGTFTAIDTGNYHNCVVFQGAAAAVCWGDNGYGKSDPP